MTRSLAFLFVVFTLICFSTPAKADLIYQSSTGNTLGGGPSLNSSQFIGSRFTIGGGGVSVTDVGGFFSAISGTIDASILSMSGPIPSGSPFNGSEVLATTTFTPFQGDNLTPLSVALPAGDYALVFSTGVLGGTGNNIMSGNGTNTPEGTGSYFFWNGTNWQNGGVANARFVVEGTPVPEPTSSLVLALTLSLFCRRARR